MFDFKKTIKKVKKEVKNLKVEKITKQTKKIVQEKLKSSGMKKEIENIKKEGDIISKAVKKTASEFYEDNKEQLEQPVEILTETFKKLSPYKDHLKWTGIVVAGITMPISTIVASSVIYLLSEDDTKDKKKKEKNTEIYESIKKETNCLLTEEDIPEILVTKNSLVTMEINLKEKTVSGVINTGRFKGKTLDEIGIENVKGLLEIPDIFKEEEAKETKTLINEWLKYKEKQKEDL